MNEFDWSRPAPLPVCVLRMKLLSVVSAGLASQTKLTWLRWSTGALPRWRIGVPLIPFNLTLCQCYCTLLLVITCSATSAAPGDVLWDVVPSVENWNCWACQGGTNVIVATYSGIVARWNLNGEKDTAFVADQSLVSPVQGLVVNRAGRVLIRRNSSSDPVLLVLNSDGTMDGIFKPQFDPGDSFESAAFAREDRILCGAWSSLGAGRAQLPDGSLVSVTGTWRLNQLLPDGQRAPTFFTAVLPLGSVGKAIQPLSSGKILVGLIDTLSNVARIVRFNPDGTADLSFKSIDFVLAGGSPALGAIQTNSLGQIIVAGQFTNAGGEPRQNLLRLDRDGSLDSAFVAPPINGPVRSMALQEDGKLVIVGAFTHLGGCYRNGVARITPNGRLDEGFTVDTPDQVSDVAVAQDGAMLARIQTGSGATKIVLLDNGDVEPGLPSCLPATNQVVLRSGDTHELQVTVRAVPSAKFQWLFNQQLLEGATNAFLALSNVSFSQMGSYALFVTNPLGVVTSSPIHVIVNAAPLKPGSVDAGFQCGAGFNGPVKALLSQKGSYLVGGTFRQYGDQSVAGLVRLKHDGSLDPTFQVGANWDVTALVADSDDKILVAGEHLGADGKATLIRIQSDGTEDTSFRRLTGLPINALCRGAGGGIYVGGNCFACCPCSQDVIRLTPDGRVDTTFRADPALPSLMIHALEPLDDGRLFFWGVPPTGGGTGIVARVEFNGSIDSTFRKPTELKRLVTGVIPREDGSTLLGLLSSQFSAAFTNQNGSALISLDANQRLLSYSPAVSGVDCMLKTERGILVSGHRAGDGARLWRVLADGTFDPDFGCVFTTPQSFSRLVGTMLSESDGTILIGGEFTQINGVPRRGIARVYSSEQVPQPLVFGPFTSETGFQLRFPTVPNHSYRLEAAINLPALEGEWTTLTNLTGDGGWITVTDSSVPTDRRFYRVRAD
jgi:uncharacterized delta-60 repeat protein